MAYSLKWLMALCTVLQATNTNRREIEAAGDLQVPVEAISAWDGVRSSFSVTRGEFASRDRSLSSQEFRTSKTTVKRDGKRYVYTTETLKGNQWEGEVSARNDKYGFQLKRVSAGARWVLTELSSMGADEQVGIQLMSKVGDQLTLFALTLNTVSLMELVRTPNFHITSLENDEGNSRIRTLKFSVGDPTARLSDGGLIKFKAGSIKLDTGNHWLPVSYALEFRSGQTFSFEHSDFRVHGAVTYPAKQSAVCTESDGSQWTLGTMNVESLTAGAPIPYSEFTLSAFGLPEPFEPRRRIPPYVWMAALAAVTIAVGLLLRARARARAA